MEKLWSFDLYPKSEKRRRWSQRCLEYAVLLGGEATKEKVLRRINDASLVQIAAHGDAERGEIALTPNSSVIGVPMKDDVVLTVKRMAVVGIRAKLVVLLKLLSQCKGEDPKS